MKKQHGHLSRIYQIYAMLSKFVSYQWKQQQKNNKISMKNLGKLV